MELITIDDQIRCVQRELALRRNVYRKRIKSGKMKFNDANREIFAMEAVLRSLEIIKSLEEDPERYGDLIGQFRF